MKKSIYDKWIEDGQLENVLTLMKKWRSEGAELNEIAEKLQISRTTLFDYQAKYSDIADALKIGKEVMDAKVENSLIKECIGYPYEETTTTTVAIIDKKTGQPTSLERIEKRTTKRYARPSITAIAYYLNNRAPSKWKNRMVVDTDDENGILPKLIEALNESKD